MLAISFVTLASTKLPNGTESLETRVEKNTVSLANTRQLEPERDVLCRCASDHDELSAAGDGSGGGFGQLYECSKEGTRFWS